MSQLSLYDIGANTPIILLHGFCESKEIWKSLIDQLAESARVIVPDLPGFGENGPIKSPVSIEFFADQIYELVNQLQLDKVILVGHSMGGYVALSFAEKYSEKLIGLGLFHSTAAADTPSKKSGRDQTLKFLAENTMGNFARGFAYSLFSETSSQLIKPKIEEVKQIIASTHKSTAIASTEAMRDRSDKLGVLKNIEVPVLFIAGKNDKVIPLASLSDQIWMPKEGLIYTMDEVAHFGMIEKPDQSVKILNSFIRFIDHRA